ncbi:MAG: aspartate ammonia-lyase [Verrucomicrobia bacterium GWC2_42_7]|nr:MAG: aspartate ammonia-lyase [Verrucomicrobia bacterium GWC2_42_7]
MRIEKDSMGTMAVPDTALYGASTQRAVLNFPISGYRMPPGFIKSLGLLKYACACANEELGKLGDKADILKKVCLELIDGQHLEHFPIDVFQTGSCTSTNTNANEVIANRASQLLGKPMGSKDPLHPNDHCNMGQSSNDTMPTTLHISVACALKNELTPSLQHLYEKLDKKAKEWDEIVKIGRTHLMDATPLTLGQEFSGYAAQVKKAIGRTERAIRTLSELAIGGTAVGTGINCHRDFPKKVIRILSEKTGIAFSEAENHFEAQGARDDCIEVAGCLNAIAAGFTKIANDIRLLGSGPRSGLGELILPATQPGSSIMPGKVNPVMSEMLIQSSIYTHGLMNMVVICGRDGHFELNVTIPLIAYALLESIKCLSNGARIFADRCVAEIQPNIEKITEHMNRSLMLGTALNPYIGYDKASHVAKTAFEQNKTLKEVVLEEHLMDPSTLDKALNPSSMTHPGE